MSFFSELLIESRPKPRHADRVVAAWMDLGLTEAEAVAARQTERNLLEVLESDSSYKDGKVTITVIKPGLNKSKTRFYPAEVLKRDYQVFENAKMFMNHQTDGESKVRPEGDLNHWVAQVTKVWAESDGTIKAQATVIDPTFKQKLSALAKAGLLSQMGVSIRAQCEAENRTVGGRSVAYIEKLVGSRSVDFVTYPGAGGQVEAMENEIVESEPLS